MAGESADEAARRRRERADRLARQAASFERGAAGERRTAEELTRLPSDAWVVLHDVQWPGRRFANIDHVVVGPGGIFVIDSKQWSGKVEIRQGVLRQNGRSRAATVEAAAAAARSVAALLPTALSRQVHPVLCFVGDDGPSGRVDDVEVCTTPSLTSLLTGRRSRLDPAQVRRAGELLLTSLPSAPAPRTPSRPTTTAEGRRLADSPAVRARPVPRSRRRGRRRRRAGGADLIKSAVAFGVAGVLLYRFDDLSAYLQAMLAR